MTVDGADYYEIGRETIDGIELVLMEHCQDGDDAPAIIIEAKTNRVIMGEVYDGFQDYRDEQARIRQTGRQ